MDCRQALQFLETFFQAPVGEHEDVAAQLFWEPAGRHDDGHMAAVAAGQSHLLVELAVGLQDLGAVPPINETSLEATTDPVFGVVAEQRLAGSVQAQYAALAVGNDYSVGG